MDRSSIDPSEKKIYGARDSRELVMEKVYADLMFAAQNISGLLMLPKVH